MTTADVQDSTQITTNKPTPDFLQALYPSCRPSNSVRALKGKLHHPASIESRMETFWYRLTQLSLRFNGHFPGEPGSAGVYWSKGGGDNWTTGATSRAKLQSDHHQQTNIQFFYRPDALPVAQPTVSKHWRDKYHIPWTCLPQAHLGVFQLCLWPLIAPSYLGGRLPCLSAALWCQYPSCTWKIAIKTESER